MNALFKSVAVAAMVVAAPLMVTGTAQAEGERYVLVSHAPDSDSWWNTIKNGIALAGEQMGVEVEYRNPPSSRPRHPRRTASSQRSLTSTFCPVRSRPLSIPASMSSS